MGRLVNASSSALFFRNVFGVTAEKTLAAFIALSTLGNILAVMFSQGRGLSYPASLVQICALTLDSVVQELGREGVLPFSKFLASNKPFNTPAAGLFLHWFVSAIIILAAPPGDAFDFVLNGI